MPSNISFSENLKRNNTGIWNKILNHQFIIEIAEDILPISKFVFYLKQDRVFLESFCNLLAGAATIANNKQTRRWLESLIDNTIRHEMPMQHEILHQLEGDVKSIEVSVEKTTMDYVSYFERVSNSKDLAIILSAMAPCPWTYFEISEALIKKNIKSDAIKQWIQFYSSKESQNQLNQTKKHLEKLANNVDERKKIEMKNHFSVSCNFEIQFWNMAYSYRQ